MINADTSESAKNVDLASLKSYFDKLNIDSFSNLKFK